MTTITKIGGVVVVTQVIPQNETNIPLQTPAPIAQTPTPATQAPPPVKQAPPSPPTKMDTMTETFMRGQPHGLGLVQIFIGVLCILFSLTAVFSDILLVHAPLCLAVAFIVSGSLALTAVRHTSVKLVWLSLVWNMISVGFGLVGVAYVCWLLAAPPASSRLCNTVSSVVLSEEEMQRCYGKMWMLDVTVYGLLGLLLVLLVLQVCVAITVCVFSGKAIRRYSLYTPIMVEDGRSLLSGVLSGHDGDVGLLDGEGSPPNSP